MKVRVEKRYTLEMSEKEMRLLLSCVVEQLVRGSFAQAEDEESCKRLQDDMVAAVSGVPF